MRFDLIDEHSTLVPFGLGVSKGNRVIQAPTAPTEAVKRGILANGRAAAMAFALECLVNAVFGRERRSSKEQNDRLALREELSRLSERELLDIGLIPGNVRRSFWDDRHPVELMLRNP